MIHMPRQSKGFKAQPQIGEGPEPPLHIVTQHPAIIGDVLDHRPDTFEFRVAGQPRQLCTMRWLFEIDPSGDSRDMWRGIGKPQHIFGFGNAGGSLH